MNAKAKATCLEATSCKIALYLSLNIFSLSQCLSSPVVALITHIHPLNFHGEKQQRARGSKPTMTNTRREKNEKTQMFMLSKV
jgi:hypothetical protein